MALVLKTIKKKKMMAIKFKWASIRRTKTKLVTCSLCEHQLHSNHPTKTQVWNMFSFFRLRLIYRSKTKYSLSVTWIGFGSKDSTTPAISVILWWYQQANNNTEQAIFREVFLTVKIRLNISNLPQECSAQSTFDQPQRCRLKALLGTPTAHMT